MELDAILCSFTRPMAWTAVTIEREIAKMTDWTKNGFFRDKTERTRAFFESTRAPGGRGSGIDGFQEEKEAKSGIFGRGSDFVGRINEIRRTSPRKNRTRARVIWISRSESSARCRIYARKNRIWGAVFRGLCRVRLPWPEGITEDANRSAKIVLTYNRRTDDVGRDLLNKLGTTLRNLDDSNLKISLEGGGVIAGEDLNLCKIIKISKTKKALLRRRNLPWNERMVDWVIGK